MTVSALRIEEQWDFLHQWTNAPDPTAEPHFIEGDGRDVIARFPDDSIDLCLSSPPYPDGHRKPGDYGRYRGQLFQEIHKAQMRGDGEDVERLKRTVRAPGCHAKLAKYLERHREPNGPPLSQRERSAIEQSKRIANHRGSPNSRKEIVREGADRFLHGQPNAAGARGLAVHLHPDEWLSWFRPFAREVQRVLKPNRPFLLNVGGTSFPRFHQHGFIYKIPAMLETLGFSLVREITWTKPNGKPVSAKHVMADKAEKVWWFQKGRPGETPVWYPWEISKYGPDRVKVPVVSNVWEISVGRTRWPAGQTHFACFPEELATRGIKGFSAPGDLVLDPFMGSGTTAIAAAKLGRRWVGIDLNPEGELDCARARWAMEFGGETCSHSA